MAKLYPPYIDGSLPAAYLDNTGWHITIPFTMNRAVALSHFNSISVIIRTITGETVYSTTESKGNFVNDFIIHLVVDEKSTFNVGQYYKVQLAYIDATELVGYYSTVGIMKGIAKPNVSIKMDAHAINFFQGSFTGVYEIPEKIDDIQIYDLSERVYSYQFNIYDSKNKLYATSGVLTHDNNKDSLAQDGLRFSYDTWTPTKFGEEDSPFYTIEYKITTLNNYEGTSLRYRLQMQSGLTMSPSMVIYPLPDFENGCVEIVLIGQPDETLLSEQKYTGSYSICRRVVSDYEDESWVELHRFRLTNQEPSTYTFRDFTVGQGVTYKYSIQQINSYGMFTSRIISAPVYADFEDMFLFDGRRVLRIRFNPKVASFKTTLQESKTDTIGSKYPYFFRNGNVAYKEFPIAGLLSYFIDDAELFIKDAALGLEPERGSRDDGSYYWGERGGLFEHSSKMHEDVQQERFADYSSYNITYRNMTQAEKDRWALLRPDQLVPFPDRLSDWISHRKEDAQARVRTRNFTGYNMFAERKFKLEVLDWLNNGQLKLFKSPAEGNYIVRLMNNSLTPEDQLGRMIHSFQSTAYEAMDNSMASLLASGIVWMNECKPALDYEWSTIWLHEGYNQIEDKTKKYYTKIKIWDENSEGGYISIKCPEGIIAFEIHDLLHYDFVSIHRIGDPESYLEDIVIGPTGNYIMQHEIAPAIDEIRLQYGSYADIRTGHIDICFRKPQVCDFDGITGVTQQVGIARQIPGENKNILSDKKFWYIKHWDRLKISLRPIIPVFYDTQHNCYYLPPEWYKDPETKTTIRRYDTINEDIIDDCGATYGIYRVYEGDERETYSTYVWNGTELERQDNFVLDTRYGINGNAGKLDDYHQYVEYRDLDALDSLYLGTGVIAEATYETFELQREDEQ